MLILKSEFKISRQDFIVIQALVKVYEDREVGYYNAQEKNKINDLWLQYSIDDKVNSTFGINILNSEIAEYKGDKDKKYRAKIVMLEWVGQLKARPSLIKVYNTLLNRYAFRKIFSAAYDIKR